MAWYRTHGRHDLPWRQTRDPYAIWLSEVMLQQTQVSTVLARFYHPFLQQFPTVQSLAAAPREVVMKAWEGLGYYRRAGFLHEAAKEIVRSEWWVAESEGPYPTTLHTTHSPLLTRLPGIGRNTAHAILAFAYHQPVAILEANVKRVVARIFALKTPTDAQLWQNADALLNRDHPFDYNQAMMDLGALICTPKAPDCPRCPANTICAGQVNPEIYPAPKTKKKTPVRQCDIQVTQDASGKLYLKPRQANLLGGLYGFPQRPLSSSPRTRGSKATRSQAPEIPACAGMTTTMGQVTHIYSHFKLIGTVMLTRLPETKTGKYWFTRGQIAQLPLSKLDHKVLALIDNCHTAQKKNAKVPAARTPR